MPDAENGEPHEADPRDCCPRCGGARRHRAPCVSDPHAAESDAPAGPLSEGGFRYSDRAAVLCRTCLRTLTWETRTEPGCQPRTGWYDDARSDPLICFKARDYRHVPLTDREWAYYEAGQRSVIPTTKEDQ